MKTLSYNFLCGLLLLVSACTQPPTQYTGSYPDEVGAIFENKCATSGCHNDLSYANAAAFRLDTWSHLWEGSSTGALIIPYDIKNSSLLYFINTDSSLGPIIAPQMPLNAPGLSAKEYETIRSWIAAGAPDKEGNIPFASDPEGRQKIYITQQGCDLMAVVDAQTNLIMRYIEIGKEAKIEIPHCVRFTPDGKFAFVSFSSGNYLQKIDASKDEVVADVYLGDGSWNLFHIADDGKHLLIADYNGKKILYIDAEKMEVIYTYEYEFSTPHGIAANAAFDTFFVTSQFGNTVYRISLAGNIKALSIDGNDPNNIARTYDPHEIIMSPDYSKYFLTCEASNEVRVMDAHTNKLTKIIPVGTFPQEFSMSMTKPYLFVSCQEEVAPEFPTFKGAVYVIDYNTLELVKRIPGPFYQVHGVSVDDADNKLFIASRNVSTSGPAPHHTSQCAGRNGYYNVYDLNTLSPATNRRFEATVDPYSTDTRFKH